MEIISWNINGIGKRFREIPNILNECDILCLSETRLCEASKYHPSFPNHNCVRKDRGVGNGGGLIILLHKNISYLSINLQRVPQGVEVIGLKIKHDQLWIHLFSIYIPPQRVVLKDDLEEFFGELEKFDNCIITGYLNAHNPLWGSDLINYRGNWLPETILESNLKVLNTGLPTRVHPIPGKISVPDIGLATNDISLRAEWDTIQDVRGSDHFPMLITISGCSSHKQDIQRRIGTTRVEWDVFKTKMSEFPIRWPDINQENHLEVYNDIMGDIKIALKEAGALMLDDEGKRTSPKAPIPVN